MAPTTRLRSRSSVDHIFDLVGDLDEDQLSNLLHELNSSTESNVPVHEGVEYFEEQRLARGPPKVLRPTPSFLNQPHEPADWPKQKPRAVSGSQWRQSMRVASPPYASIKRNQTEPISPPLTASPPLSPPLSPPKHLDGSCSPTGPRRSVTAPVSAMEKGNRVAIESVRLERPISPPRQLDEEDEELDDEDYDDETQSPSSDGFASFSFSLDGGLGPSPATPRRQMPKEEEAGVSPRQSPRQQQQQPQQQQQQQLPRQRPQEQQQQQHQHQRQPSDFSRLNTMHLSSLHLHSFRQEKGLAGAAAAEGLPRPRTSTGDASTTASALKPRAFRRISRPVFLSPANIPAPDVLAQRLSQCLFEDPEPSSSSSTGFSAAPARGEVSSGPESSLEAMLKEPVAPRSRGMFGRAEREVPSVGIFEVLSEG
ncbi:hypothetical protein SLS53_005650 [Cytospora paraplurivora]|uniref:Uncharacterized protein n=1 Tax=Cytospora paraplurivora TaxID=2898453 RepID=A0AAN9U7I4_9PEZI